MSELADSVRRVLAMLATMPVENGTAEELGPTRARERTRRIWADYWSAAPIPVDRVLDGLVQTADAEVPVRLYDPGSDGTRPLVYVHGGGFVLGDLDTHDVIPRHLSLYSGRPVISVGYRRAPEHPYPAPLLDVAGVVQAVAANATGLDIDGAGVMLGGDSAGASLALGAAMRLRGTPAAPAALLLLFGCYDPAMAAVRASPYAAGHGLAASDVRWFWAQYLQGLAAAPPAEAAPLGADLGGLPRVYLGVPGCDPLRGDSETLRDRLIACGADPVFRLWPGMIHGCIGMVRALNEAHAQLADAAGWLSDRRQTA